MEKAAFLRRALTALLVAFIGLYCLQIASPLRLNTDSYRFLSMAVSAAGGNGFLVDGKPDVFPEGYPVLLVGLIRMGLGSARWINALGIFSVLIAMLAFWALLSRDAAIPPYVRTALVLLPLASWVWIKHATIPLSENPYCALSYAALFGLVRAWQARGWKAAGWFVLAAFLSLCAWRVRSVGVSLVASVAFTVAWHPLVRTVWLPWLPRSKELRGLLALAILLLAGAAGVSVWRGRSGAAAHAQPGYLLEQRDAAGPGGLAALVASSANSHAHELGEVVLNLPATRFGRLKPAFLAVGLLTLAACLAGLPRLWQRFPPVAVYAVAYCGIILVWPFYDPRFWMPIWPVVALSLWLAAGRWRSVPPVRLAVAAYVAVFLALGLVALGISTRLSLAGPRFAQIYGDGTERDTYRVAFGVADRTAAPNADERFVRMLQRFEPLAQKPRPMRPVP
jgi:hypothetical protein